MQQFMFVLEIEQERIVYEVEMCRLGHVELELLDWLKEGAQEGTVELR
jgi:hypothetical protein